MLTEEGLTPQSCLKKKKIQENSTQVSTYIRYETCNWKRSKTASGENSEESHQGSETNYHYFLLQYLINTVVKNKMDVGGAIPAAGGFDFMSWYVFIAFMTIHF